MSASTEAPPPRISLLRLGADALLAGTLGFGGGFAVTGRLRRTFVDERRWLTADAFIELAGVASALPGTVAGNLFAICGYRLRGWRGTVVAASGFVAPSAALLLVLAVFYDTFRGVPWVRVLFAGMNPAVVGIVAAVALHLGRDAVKRPRDAVIAAAAAALLVTHALTLVEVVTLAALIGIFTEPRPSRREPPDVQRALLWVRALPLIAWPLPVVVTLALVFAKISLVTFGGGAAMIPAIEHESIGRGWVDASAFADAIALGQITPGPIAVSSTFIGYRAAGFPGALMATLGMFAPPALLSALTARSLAAFAQSPIVRGILRGIGPAVVGIIVAATQSLGEVAIDGRLAFALAVLAFAIRVVRPRSSPLLPIAASVAVRTAAALLHLA